MPADGGRLPPLIDPRNTTGDQPPSVTARVCTAWSNTGSKRRRNQPLSEPPDGWGARLLTMKSGTGHRPTSPTSFPLPGAGGDAYRAGTHAHVRPDRGKGGGRGHRGDHDRPRDPRHAETRPEHGPHRIPDDEGDRRQRAENPDCRQGGLAVLGSPVPGAGRSGSRGSSGPSEGGGKGGKREPGRGGAGGCLEEHLACPRPTGGLLGVLADGMPLTRAADRAALSEREKPRTKIKIKMMPQATGPRRAATSPQREVTKPRPLSY